MNKIKDKLNVRIKYLVVLLVLITFTACSNRKKVDVKDERGVLIESYFINEDHPNLKVGLHTKFYDNGTIMETLEYNKDGRQDGKHIVYFPSGKLMKQEELTDNKYEGKYISYYEDGSLDQEGSYKDNMMDGVWKTYYPKSNNTLKTVATMKKGQINGPYKEYYPNGKLNAEGNRVQLTEDIDVYDGKVNIYDSLGTLEKTVIYDKGKQPLNQTK